MKKTLFLTIACLFLILNWSRAQDTYLSCDFEEGMPASFKLYDVDRLEPSADMKELGFAVGTPWVVLEENGNKAAYSTSWYKTAETSNDWMVTSKIFIDSEKAVLSWKASAGNTTYRDGYAVYIALSSNNIEDFEPQPIFSTSKEEAQWTAREVSLAAYAGKDVYIAFVNNSRDRHTLRIDDIWVGVPSLIGFTLDVGSATPEKAVTIKGTMFPTQDSPITEFDAYLSYKGNTYKKEYTGLNIQPGETFDFAFNRKIALEVGEVVDYEVRLVCQGDATAIAQSVSSFGRRIVAEEPTGTWCGFCVRGHVAMHDMKEKYPELFIGIAVHNNDPMEEDYYDTEMSKFYAGGFPRVIVNRNFHLKGDPEVLSSLMETALTQPTVVSMRLETTLSEDKTTASSRTRMAFANDYDKATFALAFVVVEDNVQGAASGYDQVNYYAGGSIGAMGGYENLPDPVPANQMVYQDVAHSIFGQFYGIEGSVPAVITKGAIIEVEHDFEVPEAVMNINNAHLIALLLDTTTGEIMNAEEVSFNPQPEEPGEPEEPVVGIAPVCDDAFGMEITGRDNSFLYLKISAPPTAGTVSIYSVAGQKVYESAFSGNVEPRLSIPVNALHGVYILRVTVGNKVVTRKIML